MYKLLFIAILISFYACEQLPQQQIPTDMMLPVPKGIKEIKDLVFAKYSEVEVRLDLYKPKAKKKLPCIILSHGGGWWGGNKESHQGLAVRLSEAGFIVANVNYRLSETSKFPSSVEDTKAAIRWVRANAEKYNIDSEHIFGVGASAGGHLMAMAGFTPVGKYEGTGGNNQFSSEIKAIAILGSGVDQYARALNAPNNYIKSCELYLGKFAENTQRYKDASPINYINKNNPAVYMIDGEKDRPFQRYVEFVKKLDEHQVTNDSFMIPNAQHAQWKFEPYRTQYAAKISEFFSRHL